jgi:hypothetical protein
MNNDELPYEKLLKAQPREPSPSFEEALRAIPSKQGSRAPYWWVLKPLAIAASLLLSVSVVVEQFRVKDVPDVNPVGNLFELEETGWLELLALAQPLEASHVLTSETDALVLEYYAFNP